MLDLYLGTRHTVQDTVFIYIASSWAELAELLIKHSWPEWPVDVTAITEPNDTDLWACTVPLEAKDMLTVSILNMSKCYCKTCVQRKSKEYKRKDVSV
jgi:hypothetical protein